MKTLLTIFLFIMLNGAAMAGTVKGVVTDRRTGEQLVGSTVALKNTATGQARFTSVGLDGSFTFKNVEPGAYLVTAKYLSYVDESKTIQVSGETPVIVNLSLQSKSRNLGEVVVTARGSRESDQSARRLEQRSDRVLNAISSRSIETSPDITIANVTQRISGLSVERSSNGEAQYAIIRGMPQRYQYTLIDGIKVPSPSNTNRYVPLDIFPADIVDRLEVYKSLTASQEGDAIGGAINLALKEAPEDFTLRVNVGTGYAENFFDNGFTRFDHSASLSRSPRATNGDNYVADLKSFPTNPFKYSEKKVPLASILGLSIGGRSANKKFGALLAASYQNTYRETNSIFFNTQVNLTNNDPSVQDFERRTYNIQQQRSSLIGKLDYHFNQTNKLTLNAAFINLTQNEYRFASDTSFLSRTGVGNGRVSQDYRSDRTIQKIYNFNLQGDHQLFKNVRFNWTGVYSKATANEPDRADLNLNTGRNVQPDGSVVQAPTTFDALGSQTRRFTYNSDEDKTGYANLIFSPTLFNTKIELSTGGMYRDKQRHSDYDEYTLRVNGNTAQTFDGDVDKNTFEVFNGQGTSDNALNYSFTEKIGAAYGQFKFTAGKLQTIGGLRYEHTSQNYATSASNVLPGKTGSNKYYDVLPSLSFKYNLSGQQAIRLTYYSAISRPNFYEIVPHVTSNGEDADYLDVGNPYLKRTTAENFDLRYELFPKGGDQLLVGGFYKELTNPIENALVRQASGTGGTGTGLVLQPENFGNAHNYGFELEATKFVSKFGVRFNYTFTDSKITTSKLLPYRDENGFVTNRLENQTRPLQGQSKHIGNFSFLYKDSGSGLDAQISLVYTGPRINLVSGYLDNDVWQKSFTTLDFSTEKRLFKNLYGYFKASNLLNTPYQLELHRPYPTSVTVSSEFQKPGENAFVRRDSYNRYYILGLRYRL